MRRHSRLVLTLALSGAAACADSDITSPGSLAGSGVLTQTASVEVCRTIDFDSFMDGDEIHAVSIPDFGLNLTVSTLAYAAPFTSTLNHVAKAWDTGKDPNSPNWKDEDLLSTVPTTDNDPDVASCTACADLGNLLVIEDRRGFGAPALEGDHTYGGEVTFSGFDMVSDDYFIKSYLAIDDDEPVGSGVEHIRLFVDAVQVGTSTSQGDGTVEMVSTSSQPVISSSFSFKLGTETPDGINGSGAIDEIQICRVEEQVVGSEGCTLGFWKNHDGSKKQENEWLATGYLTDDTLEEVFDVPDAYGLDGVTLRGALELKGGKELADKAGLLLKQAVAALLSASHPEVDYPVTSSDIISDVNAALASGDQDEIQDLQNELDEFNNLGCTVTTND